jgi:uncharacterized protein DUF3306
MNDEQFLARWSRRKQDAKTGQAELTREEAAEAHAAVPDPAVAEAVSPETELPKLPPLESIDAATDITAFLRKGIPQELSRAALRRAWSADPTIRDFVGLAENAWDFNDPNAMAGFGALDYSAEQVDALVRCIVGGVVEAAETVASPPTETAECAIRLGSAEAGPAQSSNPLNPVMDPRRFGKSTAGQLPSDSVSHGAAASDAGEAHIPRRTHGGALPR